MTTRRRSKSRTAQCPQGFNKDEPGTSTRKNSKKKKPSKSEIVCPKKLVNSDRYYELLNQLSSDSDFITCNVYIAVFLSKWRIFDQKRQNLRKKSKIQKSTSNIL